MRRRIGAIAVAATLGFVPRAQADAQGVAISGSSSAQYIELRPLVLDSVPYLQTDSAWGVYRRAADGTLARCDAAQRYCSFLRSATPNSLVAMTQDLDVSAWGFGQGMSLHAQLRGRGAAGDARELWPQATQTFDALSAYLELDRSAGRARLGRQWITSSLGVFNFDGAAILFRPTQALHAEIYGGGTLVEGLNRSLSTEALSPVEDLPPTDGAYLLGTTIQLRRNAWGALRAQYQREIRHDRAGLYSERFAADGEARLGARGTVAGQLSRDLATGSFNDLSLSLRMALPGTTNARLEARRYTPYFDLWTIWGAFAPVGYDELRGNVDWSSADARVSLGASGGRRSYRDTQTGVASLPLRTSGWRLGGTAAFRATTEWSAQASYNVDVGVGASSSDGDVTVRWSPSDRLSLGVHGLAFQNIYEFQVGSGRVLGGGGEGVVRLTPDIRLVADALVYHNTGSDRPQLVNWNQRRATVRLEWAVGEAGRAP
jgi:hypothetical protein